MPPPFPAPGFSIFRYAASRFGDTVKAFCSQHALAIKKTPLAYWSTGSIKKIISSMPTHAPNLCLVAAYSNSWGDRLRLKQMNEQMRVDSSQPQVHRLIGVWGRNLLAPEFFILTYWWRIWFPTLPTNATLRCLLIPPSYCDCIFTRGLISLQIGQQMVIELCIVVDEARVLFIPLAATLYSDMKVWRYCEQSITFQYEYFILCSVMD